MNEPVVRLVCFELCGEAFAFNMEHLIEIVQIRASEITPCSTPVPFVRGSWVYRTIPIYIIDVREFFHLTGKQQSPVHKPTPYEPTYSHIVNDGEILTGQNDKQALPAPKEKRDKSMLVVQIHGSVLGIFSDAVLQVVPLGVFYEYPDMISTLPRQYFAGIIRVRKALAFVLAIDELVSEYELELLASMRNVEPEA